MFTMEVPYIPVQDTPIVLVQAATPGANTKPDYLFKICTEKPSAGGSITAMNMVDPATWLAAQLQNRSGQSISSEDFTAKAASIKLTQLQGTSHGKLIPEETGSEKVSYTYESKPGYVGKDKAVFMAEFEGKRYKIVIDIIVTMDINERSPQCPSPKYQFIKINKPASGSSGLDSGAVTLNISDLPGGAVGQTTGTTITLDTNAAGNGWFIDSTPGDNSEFLPTSNPYEWQARAGSAASGKMDMLSVLLHEYGHALGIEHSADSRNFMATTLTAGVRRLPSAEELALMQHSSAVLKPRWGSQTKPTWLTGFIGADKESKQDAASLSKLSVSLKGKK